MAPPKLVTLPPNQPPPTPDAVPAQAAEVSQPKTLGTRIRRHRSSMPLRRVYAQISQRVRIVASAIYDTRRFIRWSFAVRTPRTGEQMRSFLTMRYHAIEKGLSLPSPRIGFGTERLEEMMHVLRKYLKAFGSDRTAAVCVNVLEAYRDFHEAHGYRNPQVNQAIDHLRGAYPELAQETLGGTYPVTREDIRRAIDLDFSAFVHHRFSVREFSKRAVGDQLIESAVRIAQRTPSVCNRQSCRVHSFASPELKQRILKHQNGNRGFGDQSAVVLIVTADLQCFTNPGERFQGWIDGGMFSMSLIYALHSLGLGSCALNWSATADRDRAMRREAEIPDNEIVMMMIAVGHLRNTFQVTQSPRRPVEEVLLRH